MKDKKQIDLTAENAVAKLTFETQKSQACV